MRYFSLGCSLFVFWLLLSGHYTAFLITLGLLSTALCVFLASRLKILDYEGHPVHLILGTFIYYPWLVLEIFKAAIDVSKIVLSPSLPISPVLFKIKSTQKTHLGVATYGNSITLTPGTITVEAQDNELTIHALTKAGAKELQSGEMDKRVTIFEDEGDQ